MVSRAFDALPNELDFPKAACIVTSRRSIAETTTRSRGCGIRQKAAPGSSAWWSPFCLSSASNEASGPKRSASFSAVFTWKRMLVVRSALRSLMHTLEQTILETAAVWEQQGIAHGEIRPIIGAVDETFL